MTRMTRTKQPAIYTFALFTLSLIATSRASAQPMQTTTTYTAQLSQSANCRAVSVIVTRTIDATGATRTWISLRVMQCAPGGSDPYAGQVVAQANQAIPDSDYVIGRSTEILNAQTSAGGVNVTWQVTGDVHQTYAAQWVNDTRGTATKQAETSDTKSAGVTGVAAGVTVTGASGYVLVATSANSSK